MFKIILLSPIFLALSVACTAGQDVPEVVPVTERAVALKIQVQGAYRGAEGRALELEAEAASVIQDAAASGDDDSLLMAVDVLVSLTAYRALETEVARGQVTTAAQNKYPMIRRRAALLACRFPEDKADVSKVLIASLLRDDDPRVVADTMDCAARTGRQELISADDIEWLTIGTATNEQTELLRKANDQEKFALRSSAFGLRALQGHLKNDLDGFDQLDRAGQRAALFGVSRSISRAHVQAIDKFGADQLVRVVQFYEQALTSPNADPEYVGLYLFVMQVLHQAAVGREGAGVLEDSIRACVDAVAASDKAHDTIKQGAAQIKAQYEEERVK